ncbi:MAG: hypothetical protein MJK14_20675 [Rivularia sp. ALOHA_DT_140]|nr:hypothetical protein [Rivularia sp. ALOHA_DT_140]
MIAAQRPHSQELFIFDDNGKLKSKFQYPRKVRNISRQDRQDAEFLYDGYERIFKVFINELPGQTKAATKQNSSSGKGIIDETSFQSLSKSLDAITQGCQESKKTEQFIDYEICKKGNKIVKASEYASEADAGSVYWFSPDGRVVAIRYFGSGETYTFDNNGKVSAKFNVYDSKKVNNISADERKRAEETLSNASYNDILKRF